jgi:PAS domain S-box-containing protein
MGNAVQPKSLLLVEDEAVIAMDQAAILEQYGFIVHTVYSGDDAVRFCKEGRDVDLILMDIDLGMGIDGTEAAKQILKLYDIPVVFLSSHTEKEIVDRTEKISSYGYVVKNSGIVVLVASIKMAFRLFEANRKNVYELSERRKAEEALQTSLDHLRRSQSVARIGNWVLDLTANVFQASEEGLRLFGFPADATPGFDEVVALIDPADRPRLKSVLSESLQSGNSYQVEMKITARETGMTRHILSIGEIGHDSEGNPSRVVGINLDITERVYAENALRESEEKYRNLVENINDIIFTLDSEGCVTYISPRVYQLSGYRPDELIGRNFTDFIYPEDMAGLMESYQQTMEGTLAPYEYRVLHKDGSVRFVRTFSSVIAGQGKPTCLTGIMTDVTERRRVDEAIKVSEQKYNAFIDSSVDMVFLKDEDLRYTMVNPNLAEFFGKEREDVVGLTDFDLMPEEAAINCRKSDLETLENRRTVVNEEKVGDRFFETIKFPVTIGQSTVVGGYIRNITQRKNAETALALAFEEKQALLRELQHRIKNTMVMITSMASLEAGASRDTGVKAALESIKDRINTLSNLYSLLYSSDKISELRLDTYLRSVAESLISAYTTAEKKFQIHLELEKILCNTKKASSLGLILNELLTNTLKYAYPEGSDGMVFVSLHNTGADIELAVSDNGLGVGHGFDMTKTKGFGLKLATMLVKQHRGTIEHTGNGTTVFTVRVPRM